ncbi:hypothetical protein HOY82DRAFT_575143 [Tuber indicum]|nr:hypothetical protein HOY82DRAFT_575143 [Tuber indicum]
MLWASEYKVLVGIFNEFLPLIMQKISAFPRLKLEYYPNEDKIVLSTRGWESLCYGIPGVISKFLFRPGEKGGFDVTTSTRCATRIKVNKDYIIPDFSIFVNNAQIPVVVIDVVNEKSEQGYYSRLNSYIAGKGRIHYSILLSTSNVDPMRGLKKTRSLGKIYISAYEITNTDVQTLVFKTEIWPRTPKGELVLDRIWEEHAHLPLNLLHDSIREGLGRGDTSITKAVRKATNAVTNCLNICTKEDKEVKEDKPKWPLKKKCTEVNLGRRITIWREPTTNPSYLVLRHQL